MIEFTITDEHLKLSKRMFVSWWDCEFGAPAIDCKRPYGNSSVEDDMMEILEIDDPRKHDDAEEWDDIPDNIHHRLYKLHKEMQVVLQIWLCTGQIMTGTFVRDNNYNDLAWRLKENSN